MKNYDTVIFDLDGTLLNTLDDLADSANAVLREHGFPLRTADEVRRFVGNGVERLITLCLPEGTDEKVYKTCLDDFKRRYSQNMRNRTAPYPGIPDLLEELRGRRYKLAVVSNKFDEAVGALCRSYFGAAIDTSAGSSEDTARKPAPGAVFKVLRALGSTPERALYVGDSEVDAATAKNAGMPFVGVTWGFRDREVLERTGAARIIDRPEELLELLDA
jgi:phosphoglycolate phosphatase